MVCERYIDIGVNLTASAFRNDLDEVVRRAVSASVEKMIVTGTDMDSSLQAITLAEVYTHICYATSGIHPHHASDYSAEMYSELKELVLDSRVVAVGECGLDFNRNYSGRREQIRAFEAQLELAAETNKPVFLHQRDAHDEFVGILKNFRPALKNAVAHCFTGDIQQAEEYLELDMYMGITGWIADERRGHSLQQAVKHIPLDRIMLETDAPYLLPRNCNADPVKKNRNEPCLLPEIASITAAYMQQGVDKLALSAWQNSIDFFGIEQNASQDSQISIS